MILYLHTQFQTHSPDIKEDRWGRQIPPRIRTTQTSPRIGLTVGILDETLSSQFSDNQLNIYLLRCTYGELNTMVDRHVRFHFRSRAISHRFDPSLMTMASDRCTDFIPPKHTNTLAHSFFTKKSFSPETYFYINKQFSVVLLVQSSTDSLRQTIIERLKCIRTRYIS